MADDPMARFELGERLLANQRYGTPAFDQGLEHLLAAAQAGLPDAQVALGHVYAQVHLLPDAPYQAVRWYRQAAENGHPAAQDRLADLYMLGWGVARDDSQALTWYKRTADQYYPTAQCNLAYLYAEGIGTQSDQVYATTLYLQAAAQGDPRAYFNLGLRFVSGEGTSPNLVYAYAWMLNAQRLGYPSSEMELSSLKMSLVESERVQAQEIARRIEENFEALQYKLGQTAGATDSVGIYRAIVEENFTSLAIPEFSLEASVRPGHEARIAPSHGSYRPGTPMIQAEQPRIFTIDEFISRSESAHLINLASTNMSSARDTVDTLSQEQTAFSGAAAFFSSPSCDAAVRNIERRIAAAFELPVTHVEPLSVLRYRLDDQYAPHVDYFDDARLEQNRQQGDNSGQRTASFLVYLCAPQQGGETHYLKIGRKISGRQRMALCHYNLDGNRRGNPLTLHTGEPVKQGEKWLARTTLRESPLF